MNSERKRLVNLNFWRNMRDWNMRMARQGHRVMRGSFVTECVRAARSAHWRSLDFVTPVTTAPGALADTLSNTAAIPQPLGESKMFTRNTFETKVTALITAALLVAFVASLVA